MPTDYQKIYDAIYKQHPGYGDVTSRHEALFKLLDNFELGTRVLDVGCGTGAVTNYLDWRKCTTVGIDASRVAIKKAKLKYPNCHFERVELMKYQPPGVRFDTVVAFDVLEHLERKDIDSFFTRMEEDGWLKLGGLFIGTVSTRPSVHLDYRGQNLHLTVGDVSFWRARTGAMVVPLVGGDTCLVFKSF